MLQEAYLEASRHLTEYLRQPGLPFFLWLRGIAGNKLRELHRHHLGTQIRDAGREVSLYRGTLPETTSAALIFGYHGVLRLPRQSDILGNAC